MNKIKNNLERFVLNMPDEIIKKVEDIAIKKGVTMSWVYRSILIAVEQKFQNRFLVEENKIRRPKKFKVAFRQTVVCFYGDKHKWMSLARYWNLELGPLIRFGLNLYFTGELKLDLEGSKTVKEIKNSIYNLNTRKKIKITKNRYIYLHQNIFDCYKKEEYWDKNTHANIALMKWGLSNRKTLLILS